MELSGGIWLALWIFYSIISENQANSIYTQGQAPLSVIPWQPRWFPIWPCCASICLASCMHLFFIFFSLQPCLPISHIVLIISVQWLWFGCYWLCLCYLINTGNKVYTGMGKYVQKIMPHFDLNLAVNSMSSGKPTNFNEMLQREITYWNSL